MPRTFSITRTLKALSLLTALAGLCLAAPPRAARAAAYTYGTGTQRTVNAGVLLLDGNPTPLAKAGMWTAAAVPDDKDPYVFYILNQRSDIRPFGWNIVNPLAPSAVTPDVQLRWDARSGVNNVYQLGQTVSQAMAAYWEVPLSSTSSDSLAQFDVLLLNLENQVKFTAADAEKLRRFVDSGGTLWIEDSGALGGVNSSLLPFFQLQFTPGTASYATVSLINRHPLISTPYLLSLPEINSLGGQAVGVYFSSDKTGSTAPPQYTTTVIGDSASRSIVAVGSYGAGEIVVTCTGSANSINEYVGGTDIGVGANSGPFCGTAVQNAPTADLKLAANILNLSSTHQNEHQNSRQTGEDTGAIPSAQHTWTATSFPGSNSTGVAVYGHEAFVTDSAGALHAFDIYPAENLDNDQQNDPDEGTKDFDQGAPWDEIWVAKALGAGASTPTVAVDPSSSNVYVLVEDKAGNVARFLVGGPSINSANFGTAPSAATVITSTASGSYSPARPAPAPTYYNGRVYAGDYDGNLNVADLGSTNPAHFLVNPDKAAPPGEAVLAPPTVGIVPDPKGANDILALVTTNRGLYSVFLGSRGEPLTPVGVGTGNYNTKLQPLINARMNTATTSTVLQPTDTYIIDPLGYPSPQSATYNQGGGGAPNFSGGYTGTDTLFGDYDADLAVSSTVTPNGPLTRTVVGGAGDATKTGALLPTTTYVSAPALDRFGNAYYTITDRNTNDSVLFCVHDAPAPGTEHVNWRFRIPQSSDGNFVDADNTSYTQLANANMRFTTSVNGQVYPSAPVVDEQGNVYVLASGTGGSAILCLNGQGTVSADLLASGDQSSVNSVSITQPFSNGTDEFGNATPATIGGGQYQLNGGRIDFRNFAAQSFVAGAPGAHILYPNLSEPYPITVSFNVGGANGTPPTGSGGNAQTNATVPLHTNLSWYTVLGTTATSGLTKVGNMLYFVGDGSLNSVPADVQAEGFTISNKFINPTSVGTTGQPLLTTVAGTGVGATAAVPASAGGALLVSGPGGLSAFTNQVTLVVDSNRVVEMDGAGNAQWAVDSTTKTTLAGDVTPIYSNGSGTTGTGQLVTTSLELNHPSSVYELAQNDYLIADTGNNRCVRFDRAGKVIWELTKFYDPSNQLLKPGEPDTLNQPTSVQVLSNTNANGNTIVQYLICDNGNYRILEVDDVYNNKQVLIGNHILRWISHTHDIQGREYRYQSANYYRSPDIGNVPGKYYVAALIANKRVAPFSYTFPAAPTTATYAAAAPSLLAAANQDTNGGSIVLLDYDPDNNLYAPNFGINNQADGFIATSLNGNVATPITVNSFYADLNGQNFNIDKATKAVNAAAGAPPIIANTATPLLVRNPRYLRVYSNRINGNTVRHYLLADDNGAFDLTPGLLGGKIVFYAQWGLTQADYQGIKTPISQEGVTGVTLPATVSQADFDRSKIPFIPSSIQLTGTDVVNGYAIGRYLVTNSFSQGEAANAVGPYFDVNATPSQVQPGFSGEALEIQTLNDPTNGLFLNEIHNQSYLSGATRTVQAGATPFYIGHTLSRPASSNTSPLNQPTFAFRLQF